MRRNSDNEITRRREYNQNNRRVRPRIIDPDPNQENSQNPFDELRRNTAIQGPIESQVSAQEIINDAPQLSQSRRLMPQRDAVALHFARLEQLNEEKLRQERNKQEIQQERIGLEKELENALLNLERQNPATQQEQSQLPNQEKSKKNEIKISVGERLLTKNGGGGVGSEGKGVAGKSAI